MCRRHESGGLLMSGQDQLDAGAAQCLQQIEGLFPGYTEDPLYALVLKRGYEQLSAVHTAFPL
jgi:hypothetical protein